MHLPKCQEGGSWVSTVSDYGLDNRAIGVRSLAQAKGFFPLARVPGPTQPSVQWVLGALSLGRDNDHSPPSSAEVKNE
jgi:hypothetical protein